MSFGHGLCFGDMSNEGIFRHSHLPAFGLVLRSKLDS